MSQSQRIVVVTEHLLRLNLDHRVGYDVMTMMAFDFLWFNDAWAQQEGAL